MHGTSSCRMDVPATTFRLFSRVVIVWEVCNGEVLDSHKIDIWVLQGYYFQCFYNQPVQRKQMRSSPKRVLHSLKESLLRKSLLCIPVSPSKCEDDLLCPRASPSLLPLLFSGLGIHLRSLNKLNASDGSFKLSGNISGPDVYTVKKLSAGSFHSSHPINVINLPPQVVVTGFSVMKFNVIQFLGRPSVKRELVNIWNSKLQAQGECTCTRDGELKEEFAPTKTKNFVDSGIQWRDVRTLHVTPDVLHFVGNSLVPDTIDKNFPEGAKVLQQVDKKFIPIVASTTPDITDQVSVSIGIGTRYVKVNDNAHGRPNGYRKVLKSLFVIYLQPTSSKEANALQILFIASSEDDVLCTHSSSSLLPLLSSEFGIYQSEVDLFCTRASPSPLPLLSSGFGSHLSSLNKLNARDGSFKLSGYISCPDVYTMKLNPSLFIFFEGCELESFSPWIRFRTIELAQWRISLVESSRTDNSSSLNLSPGFCLPDHFCFRLTGFCNFPQNTMD
ncbi:hypothetical protein KY290_002883 [Solanum tuberosum]|uniref:Uncharacterized protein n=1 Tax=Solanum tuberosum TaxID=4113 RepID=A0ABQ7WTJ6_SOLTU|nr:hypothetical protein KY290_002883 [Solanum tuberosum]